MIFCVNWPTNANRCSHHEIPLVQSQALFILEIQVPNRIIRNHRKTFTMLQMELRRKVYVTNAPSLAQ